MVPAGQAEKRPRQRIGKYVVTGRIGRGGMGMVYRGYDEVLERDVAVKTLTVEGVLDEESRTRFEIEAKAAAKLQHPNIVTVFELGEDRGVPFIAMELLAGTDLDGLLRSGEVLLLEEKLEVVTQVLRGLAYAHEHRIVHRDIKPSNIRLLDDGAVKIMDFGIAKLGATSLTKSGMMVGTIHYMSPEQIRGQALDGRSDVFSVGVILCELLEGRRPFAGDTATDVLYRIVHEPHPPLTAELGPAGPRLREILDRALAKDPEARYAGAAQMADELAEVLASLTRSRAVPLIPRDLETVKLAKSLLRQGRFEESQRRLREVVERSPQAVEAVRALRAATREVHRRQRPPAAEGDEFPELEATFRAPPTRREPETVQQPATEAGTAEPTAAEAAPARRAGRGLVVATALTLLAALAAGLLLLRGTSQELAKSEPARIPVRSQPPGAAVLVDGRISGVVTDGELVLEPPLAPQVVLTFRRDGYREESRTVRLPLPAGEAVAVTLAAASAIVAVVSEPPGGTVLLDGQRVAGATPTQVRFDPALEHRLTIALEGHAPQEVRLLPGKTPPEVRVTLAPEGPLGTVTVDSTYPIDVLWRGRVLARGQASPRVSLPQGRQVLTLVSGAYFLRMNATVDVRGGGEARLATPPIGRISIQANPDNCQVFIDGTFVDYPPILDKAVAAGPHKVAFKWPDGTHREEVQEVPPGRLIFVTGRRE